MQSSDEQITQPRRRFQVQQHDGLRWDTFAWDHTREDAEKNYSGSVKCWPDRAHRVLAPNGERVLIYDPRALEPHNRSKC